MPQDASYPGSIPVSVALALLASLRDVDTPDDPDALAETDLPLNLRRRLGLSSVVVDQIKRYERRKGDVSATEVASLFELIGRRPDAATVFNDAGRRIARRALDERRIGARLGIKLLPQGLRRRRAWSRVRRIARELCPGSISRVERKPGALVIEGGLPAHAAHDGAGCALLAGAIESVFAEYRGGEGRVHHASCEATAGSCCSWEILENGAVVAGPADPGTDPAPDDSYATAAATAGAEDIEGPREEPVASG
ncbi:MAG: hypothetical protein MJB57_04450 [Gemmatimonadetes bacterium]|nr:hypothetical protein [Gemmatimonadota bacterium]